MINRRKFLHRSVLGSLTFGLGSLESCTATAQDPSSGSANIPIVISTWENEMANAEAWKVLQSGGSALDAVEQGVRYVEADPDDQSVGYGGRPDREGLVTLDACIMDEKGNAGSVCFLQDIMHPISVARKVMEETPHVMLAGNGALQFAIAHGFKKQNLLTETSRLEWEEWKETAHYQPVINIENHDTIGMLALDQKGNISGACTTSGVAYKTHGRVGDSPIIGAGLFVDNEIGGAVATGVGEAVLKTLGSFLVVELMRQGMSPGDACKEAVMRIVHKQQYKDIQVGYLAIDKSGNYGAFAIQGGFNFAVKSEKEEGINDALSYID